MKYFKIIYMVMCLLIGVRLSAVFTIEELIHDDQEIENFYTALIRMRVTKLEDFFQKYSGIGNVLVFSNPKKSLLSYLTFFSPKGKRRKCKQKFKLIKALLEDQKTDINGTGQMQAPFEKLLKKSACPLFARLAVIQLFLCHKDIVINDKSEKLWKKFITRALKNYADFSYVQNPLQFLCKIYLTLRAEPWFNNNPLFMIYKSISCIEEKGITQRIAKAFLKQFKKSNIRIVAEKMNVVFSQEEKNILKVLNHAYAYAKNKKLKRMGKLILDATETIARINILPPEMSSYIWAYKEKVLKRDML